MRKTIKLEKSQIVIDVNAYTLLIYEDRFKGRRLLQDICEIAKFTEVEKIPTGLLIKMLWSAAKTADESIDDIYEWSSQFSISEITEASNIAFELIVNSLESSKKAKAAVRKSLIRRLMIFFHMR